MRRLSAIPLFVALLLPVYLPFLVRGNVHDGSGLPACCRRDGKHHCGMESSGDDSTTTKIRQAQMGCPYRSALLSAGHSVGYHPPTAARLYAAIVSHPAIHAQVTANLLVAESRSHHKRGPPSVINS